MNGQIETVYLEFREGTSDKFYRITAVGDSSGWITTVIWGRRGSNGQTQLKYEGPSEAAAKACLSDLYHQKRAKGYEDALDPLGPAAPSAPASPANPVRVATSPTTAVFVPGVPRFPAMKAREVPIDWSALDGYVMEEKFDGHRALIAFSPDGSINVRNVYGEDKGRIANMPHIEAALRDIAAAAIANMGVSLASGTIIDGEMVGLTLAETTHLLGAGGKNDPRLRFVAFDLPFLGGVDLQDSSWLERRQNLFDLLHGVTGPVELGQIYPPTLAGVMGIWARGGEGAILKPTSSPYVPGGRYDWIKVKEHHTAEAVVTSWVPGNGKYSTEIGALVLSQWKNGRFQEVTKVSGMTDAVRKDMKVNWDTVWQDRVIEFEYQSKTPTGSYRHPRFVRPRDDKKGSDCTWETSP